MQITSRPLIVIPSRLASTRLKHKPLALIRCEPMIIHVLRLALESRLGDVVVACCGREIADVVEGEGGTAVVTDPGLASGTDRVWAVVEKLDLKKRPEIIINLQGDLPTLNPKFLHNIIEPLENSAVDIATLATVHPDIDTVTDRNIVKIALTKFQAKFHAKDQPKTLENVEDNLARAIYFSRCPIPYNAAVYYHHIGVYAYRYESLKKFVSLPPSPLEKAESLEQLRALEAGLRIDVRLVDQLPQSVDTPNDLENVRQWFDNKHNK